jgi:4-hydroxybenzoate polyprenyltransferase
LLRGVLLGALCLAFAYGWNTVKDHHLDEPAARAAGAGALNRMRAVLVALVALALGLAASANPVVLGAVALSLAGGALYSGGPRLKAIPIVGTFANTWIFAPIAFFASEGWPPHLRSWLLLTAFATLLLQNQLIHEAAHLADDRREGIRTTLCTFGPAVGRELVVVFGLAAALALFATALAGTPLWGAALAALPSVVFTARSATVRLDDHAAAEHLRRWQRLSGLLAGALAWLLPLLLAAR